MWWLLGLLTLEQWAMVAAVVLVLMLVTRLGLRVIGPNESGLLIKRYGAELPAGHVIALDGEAGYQARMLGPGWHFPVWRWQYRVVRVPVLVVQPGDIALVVAADGRSIPAGRVLGREVACDSFQDAGAFLRNGGERGRQLAFVTAGTYRINPAAFEVVTAAGAAKHGMTPSQLRVYHVAPDRQGIVTTLDGRAIPAGDLAGPPVPGHDSFQRGQAFIDAGGCRGLQEDVLLAGSWNLNPWFVEVEQVPLTEIPIGYVGVVVSYVGNEHVDVSGDAFTHGDLVERGRKGVWIEPLLPGKHPINTRVMKAPELHPRAQQGRLRLQPRRLADHPRRHEERAARHLARGLHAEPRGPRAAADGRELLPQLGAGSHGARVPVESRRAPARGVREHSPRDRGLRRGMHRHLIGDIVPPAELMKTQTDRKIAEEMERTYQAQREAQVQRQELERETAVANMQAEVVRSEQMVRIAERNALAVAEAAKGEAAATRVRAEGQADAVRVSADAEAMSVRAVGAAKAEAYRLGIEALGAAGYTALQVTSLLGEHRVKLVPDIAVSGADGGPTRLADVLIGRMLQGMQGPAPQK